MELKEFISETLTQIAQGVKDAQGNVASLGAKVNPSNVGSFEGNVPHCKGTPSVKARLLCDVEFNVSLTDDKSSSSGAGISVLFGAFSINAGRNNADREVSLNSIKFNVVMELPKQD